MRDEKGNAIVGAVLRWDGTNVAEVSDENGDYEIHKVKDHYDLIAGFAGMQSDTVTVDKTTKELNFTLVEMNQIEGITVEGNLGGNYISLSGINKDEMISFAGLCKMACCNLAESFENSASVTVGYSDAISGARQIKMLGLAGTYTQILDENRAIMRGISSPYALSYTPGMWLNSIQVSKGISSVTAGHEAITGQINLEYRKPTDDERLFLNLYLNNELRPEINLSTALPVSKDGKLSTVILLHASGDTDLVKMDHNNDGFRDTPASQQYNLANRWSYMADNGAQVRWGFKVISDNRLGGEYGYERSMRDDMENIGIYGSEIHNFGANGYFKFGMPVGEGIFDEKNQTELRSNIAIVADYDYFNEDAYFGLNDYKAGEGTFAANLMYNHYFSPKSSLIVGASTSLQNIRETVVNGEPMKFDRQENEVGVYGEYTFRLEEKFSVIAGVRGDYNSYFDKYFVTPRGQVKWNITPSTVLRASAGLGYRTSNVISDNIGILATGRKIEYLDYNNFDNQERALTLGGSLTQSFKIIKAKDATLSFDYFRTDFSNTVIVDQEYDSQSVMIYNSNKPSSTDTYQLDFTWTPATGLDIFATFRYTNSSITLNRHDGSTAEVERPLVGSYKTLLNVQYATHLRRWVFDATAQLNGPMRLPSLSGNLAEKEYSPAYPMFFAQVSRRLGQWEVYVGCENIANYMQSNPILGADDPFTPEFNSSVVWGPLMGRKFYIGARFNLY